MQDQDSFFFGAMNGKESGSAGRFRESKWGGQEA